MEGNGWIVAVVEENSHPTGFHIGRGGRYFVLLLRSESWRVRALSPCCMAYISLNRDSAVCEDCLASPGLTSEESSIASWADRPLTPWLAHFAAWAEWWEPLEAEVKSLDLAILVKSLAAGGLAWLPKSSSEAYRGFSRAAVSTRQDLQAILP